MLWITNHDGTGYDPAPTFESGCGPGSCCGFCDKSMFGMCAAGVVGRFAVAQFRHTVSNGPLWVLTNTVCSYASRVHEVDATAFVDDLMNSMMVPAHGLCGGLEGRMLGPHGGLRASPAEDGVPGQDDEGLCTGIFKFGQG